MKLSTLTKDFRLPRSAILLGLLLASILGNTFSYPLFPGFDYLFGSVFALTILAVFGSGWGLLAAVASTFPAVVHCGHPYPLLWFSGEFIAISIWLHRPRSRSLVLADIFYWLFIGTPIVALVSFFALKLSLPLAAIASLKLALNGVTNAFLASIVARFFVLKFPKLQLRTRPQTALFELFHYVGFGLSLPIIVVVSLYGRSVESQSHQSVQLELSDALQHLSSNFNLLFADHFSWIHVIVHSQKTPNQPLPRYSQAIGFESLVSVDLNAQPTIISERLGLLNSSSAYNQLADISLAVSRSSKQDSIVVVPAPRNPSSFRIALVSPIISNGSLSGCVVGILDPSRVLALAESVESRTSVCVLGKDGRVLVSTSPDRTAGSVYDPRADRLVLPISSSLYKRVPLRSASALEQWQDTWYFAEQDIAGSSNLRLVLESPLNSRQNSVFLAYFTALLAGAISFGSALLAVYLGSQRVSRPVRQLLRSSALIEQGGFPRTFPPSNIDEIDRLVAILRYASDSVERHKLELESERARLQNTRPKQNSDAPPAAHPKPAKPSPGSLRRLAGASAQDFNNSLGAIIGFGDMLSTDLKGSPEHRLVAQLLNSAREGAEVSHLLLGFSARCRLQRSVVPLSSVLATCVQSVQRNAPLVRIDLAPFDDHLSVCVDRSELDLAIVEVLNNAVDAMQKGGILSIHVTVNSSVTDSTAIIRVRDSGGGMPAQVLVHAFEPYFTTKPKAKRRGLGLSFALGVVEQHGGSIALQSEFGQGTTVEIFLPVHLPTTDTPRPSNVLAPTPIPHHAAVLVLDDDPNMRSFVGDVLAKKGFRVLQSGTRKEALACFSKDADAIHLLITSVALPDSTGPEVFESLSLLQPSLRVLYMSSYADEVLVQQLEPNQNGFLNKPFDVQTLLNAVSAAVTRPSVPPPAAGQV